jgi:hypothetical protein
MGKQDVITGRFLAVEKDDRSMFFAHFQRVDHHQCSDVYFHLASSPVKHLFEMGVAEKKFSGEIIVIFIEGASCNENLNHFLILI